MFDIKDDIISRVKEKEQISIKELCEIYYNCKYISKRETRKAINSLIAQGILVRVDDTDYCGNRSDDVVMSDTI